MPLQVIAMITCEMGSKDGRIEGCQLGCDDGCELGSELGCIEGHSVGCEDG